MAMKISIKLMKETDSPNFSRMPIFNIKFDEKRKLRVLS
jgi:hypothetical protein